MGEFVAQRYATANVQALKKIADIVSNKKIDCEFHRTPLYIYTESKIRSKTQGKNFMLQKNWASQFIY
jgi:hypothetical protein